MAIDLSEYTYPDMVSQTDCYTCARLQDGVEDIGNGYIVYCDHETHCVCRYVNLDTGCAYWKSK